MIDNGDYFGEGFGVMMEGEGDFLVVDDSTLKIASGVVMGTALSVAVFSCLATYFYHRD